MPWLRADYSLEKNGAKVSQENKDLAEELKLYRGINENAGKKNFDADKLNVALTDIKTAVANAKQEMKSGFKQGWYSKDLSKKKPEKL